MVLDVEPVVSDRQLTWAMVLNTIKSKVEEIVLESMVLPNMDDISFFDSSAKTHRGGIWNDAARRERMGVPAPVNPSPDQPDDSAPTSKAAPSTPEVNVVPSTPVVETEASISRPRSSDKLGEAFDPSNDSGGQRRRTGLAGSSNGSGSGSGGNSFKADINPDLSDSDSSSLAESIRGRSSLVEPSINARSRSIPNDVPFFVAHGRTPSSEQPRADVTPHKRRLSTRSGPDSSEWQGPSTPPPPDASPRSLFSTSNLSRTKPDASPTQTSSFLATLRSRAAAADKQTISNQAKEAIRKWGVNWGANKRDSNISNPEDSGSPDRRSRADSISSTQNQPYSDIRPAASNIRHE